MIFEPNVHFPRSSGGDWTRLRELHGRAPDEFTSEPFDLRSAEFHPAGEVRVSHARLEEWRYELNRWAFDHGFPGKLNEERRSRWDVLLGEKILEDTSEHPEAENPAIWCWIATHLLPHFVVHRWGWPEAKDGAPPETRGAWSRFGATDKNNFVMVRQRVLVYGADLAARASEQEFQSIQYRPAFGLDRRVARAILEALVEAASDPDSNYGRQGSTRSDDADDVCVELRIINSLRPFCFMSTERIRAIVRETIERLPEIRDPRKEARRRANKPTGPELDV